MKGINITGETLIFKNEYGYSTTVSNKDKEGNWDKMYITIQLPKGQELENRTKISITKGFLTFYKDKNGMAKPKAVIQEYSVLEHGEAFNEVFSAENLSDDDLPF